MPDPTPHAADRLDDCLDGNSVWPLDDSLTGFAQRLVRRAALPDSVPATLSDEQRDRIRRRVFGASPSHSARRTPMWAMTTVTALPTAQPTYPSKPSALSMLMTAALVVIIGIAGVVLLRGSIDIFPDRNGSAPVSAPGFLASATPARESAEGCPLTGDVLVFVGDAPIPDEDDGFEGSFAVVRANGDLVITCDGVHDPEPLLTGVTDALPLQWPGTLMLGMGGGSAIVYNVATGERVDVGEYEFAAGFLSLGQSSPLWLLSPNNAALTDWRITHLERMTSFVLSDELGGVLPISQTLSIDGASGSSTAIISFDGAVEPSWMDPSLGVDGIPQNAADATIAELPGSGLVIDETSGTRRWIDVEGQMAVSRDGEAIAYQTRDENASVLRIEDTSSGEVLAEISGVDVNAAPGQRIVFAGDGETLVYLNEGQTWLATYRNGEGTPEPIRLAESEDFLPTALYGTGVLGRVLIERSTAENIGGPGVPGAKAISILDTATGQVTDVAGIFPIFEPSALEQFASLKHVVTLAPSPDSDSETIARLTDIASGETLITSEPLQVTVRDLIEGNNMVSSSETGAITIISAPGSEAVLLDATNGVITTITPPAAESTEETGDLRWSIVSSRDGAHLYAIGLPQLQGQGLDIEPPSSPSDLRRMGRFAIAPVSADPAWSIPADTLPAGVILGISNGDQDDESAMLEAQDVTSLDASPAATPATPMAPEGDCDLTNDIPYFVGAAPDAPFINTYALLDDAGTLTLNCDGASNVFASSVARAVPTWWPGAIALAMEDGSVQLVNLTNGASVWLESDTLPGDDGRFTNERNVYSSAQFSPWLVSAANSQFTDWRITDLRTMESMLLSEDVAQPLAEPHVPLFLTGLDIQNSHATGNEIAAIAFRPEWMAPQSPPSSAAEITPPEATTPEGNVLLLPGSLEDRRWINATTEAFAPVSVSADGSLLAYITMSGDGESMIRLEQTMDGTLVADIPFDLDRSIPSFLLAGRTPTLVLSNGRSIEVVIWQAELERTPIDHDANLVIGIYPTADPDVVLMNEGGGVVPIDIATGTVGDAFQYVPSLEWQVQYIDGSSRITNIVNIASDAPADVPATIQIVNPGTGEVLVESDPLDIHPIALTGGNLVTLAEDGSLAVVPILEEGRAIVLDAMTGDTWEVDLPIDDNDDQWVYVPSQDGRLIYAMSISQFATGEERAFFVAQAIPNAEWVKVEPGSPARYIVGTHGLPDTEND